MFSLYFVPFAGVQGSPIGVGDLTRIYLGSVGLHRLGEVSQWCRLVDHQHDLGRLDDSGGLTANF